MRGRLAAVAALTIMVGAALVAGTMSPAAAERGSKRYERGDAPAVIDITRLTVNNGEDRFAMRVDVRDLGERGRFSFHYWGGRRAAPPARSVLITVRRVDGDTHVRFLGCDREECTPVACDGLRARWRPVADVVRVSAPQQCYPRRDPEAGPPDVGRFFAWSKTATDEDPGSGLLRLDRG